MGAQRSMASAVVGRDRRRGAFAAPGALAVALAGAVLATAAVSGCTTAPPEPPPTRHTPTGPGFDAGLETVDFSLHSEQQVELNGATIAVGGASDGPSRASVTIGVGDGDAVQNLLDAGDTVEVPGWGVLGLVEVEQDDATRPMDDDEREDPDQPGGAPRPEGLVTLRAQLPEPPMFAVTVHADASVDSLRVELRADSALITPAGMGPVLVTRDEPAEIPEWGVASWHPGNDGAPGVRLETDHMPAVLTYDVAA